MTHPLAVWFIVWWQRLLFLWQLAADPLRLDALRLPPTPEVQAQHYCFLALDGTLDSYRSNVQATPAPPELQRGRVRYRRIAHTDSLATYQQSWQ